MLHLHQVPVRVQRLGFIGDAKAGVPRTAYRGVVTVRHRNNNNNNNGNGNCLLHFTPVGGMLD
jgi:hypothetical protein